MALVLSRREGERLWIGNAEVIVRKIGNGRVRLAIQADKSINIVRGELKGKPNETRIRNDRL